MEIRRVRKIKDQSPYDESIGKLYAAVIRSGVGEMKSSKIKWS